MEKEKNERNRLTFAGSDFSGSSLKVCEPRDMVFLRGVVVPSCEGRTNSILPPSTTMLGAGGKFSALPSGSQQPKSPAFSPYKGWICLEQSVRVRYRYEGCNYRWSLESLRILRRGILRIFYYGRVFGGFRFL